MDASGVSWWKMGNVWTALRDLQMTAQENAREQ